MATYTTVASFARDWWPAGGDSATRLVQSAADAAYAIINAKLNKVYTVPFTAAPSAPGIVRTISDVMTRLVVEYIQKKGEIPLLREVWQPGGAVLNPFKMLDQIIMGEMDVPGETRLTGTGAWVTPDQSGHMHIFDLDDPVFHDPDPDLMDDIASYRRSYSG